MAGATPRRAAATGTIATVALLALLSGCAPGADTSSPTQPPAPNGAGDGAGPITSAAIQQLGAAPCPPESAAELQAPSLDGVLCGTLTVPLDHGVPEGDTINLEVALQAGDRTHGAVLTLGGGPGGASRWTAAILPLIMPQVADAFQFIAIDHRGTGADALDCPDVQAQVGSSDLLAAAPDAVRACAALLGERAALQSTADTIEDLELLREALGVDRWVLDGTSYGTFVAQQYALRYPASVRAIVLDSPLPPHGVDPFLLSTMAAVPDVLGGVCAATGCGFDPGTAIERLLDAGYPALPLLNALVGSSVMDPEFTGVLDAIASALDGDLAGLDAVVDGMLDAGRAEPLRSFSSGAHIATLCADTPMPWGGADTDPADRAAALAAAASALTPEDTWPFPTTLATELGTVDACRHWPTTTFRAPSTAEFPDIPVLVLTGARDLSTPVANAEAVIAAIPHAVSVVVPDAGHAAQMRPGGIGAVSEFLLSLDTE